MSQRITPVATLAAAALLGSTAVAVGATTDDAPTTPAKDATTIVASPVATLGPGKKAPFDAPGVKAIRSGKAIPSNYRLIGREVSVTRETAREEATRAALDFTCSGGRTVRSVGIVQPRETRLDFQLVGEYEKKKGTFLIGAGRKGQPATAKLYAVCR